jgi:hypothetical protein
LAPQPHSMFRDRARSAESENAAGLT